MSELYIGLMSGTSMDGIDAVLVDLSENTPVILSTYCHSWPEKLKSQLHSVASGTLLTGEEFAVLDAVIGEQFAEAANTLIKQTTDKEVIAIGSHGQTLAHNPDHTTPFSLQLGDGNIIAEHCNITTITDFRRRDIAAGGQGAPLVPAFHQAVFRSSIENRVILNIGGIANITWLPKQPRQQVAGFDTGPGNCLMDNWIKEHCGDDYDKNGSWANQGQTNIKLLERMLSDSYFDLPIPKSTGTQYFSKEWIQQHVDPSLDIVDTQATLLNVSSKTITQAISKHCPDANRILVCGGGAHNNLLMQQLQKDSGITVESTAIYGIDPDWVEAVAFAWLAKQTLNKEHGNLPETTGAKGARILGAIHQA